MVHLVPLLGEWTAMVCYLLALTGNVFFLFFWAKFRQISTWKIWSQNLYKGGKEKEKKAQIQQIS
jgi:hypothetical protein